MEGEIPLKECKEYLRIEKARLTVNEFEKEAHLRMAALLYQGRSVEEGTEELRNYLNELKTERKKVLEEILQTQDSKPLREKIDVVENAIAENVVREYRELARSLRDSDDLRKDIAENEANDNLEELSSIHKAERSIDMALSLIERGYNVLCKMDEEEGIIVVIDKDYSGFLEKIAEYQNRGKYF